MNESKIKFMKRGVVFIIVFLVILIILNNLYINNIELKKTIYRRKIEWQEHKQKLFNNTLDYAFFGDSHITDALNPKYINNSFNFGRDGTYHYHLGLKITSIYQ